VTPYLEKAAVEETLSKIAGTAKGSIVAFDYITTEVCESQDLRIVRASLRTGGEPLKFGIDSTPPSSERLAELLRSCGLSLVDRFTARGSCLPCRITQGRTARPTCASPFEGDVHPVLPSRAVLGTFPPRRHRLSFRSDGERRTHPDGWRIARPGGGRDVAAPREMEYAGVIDGEPHHLHVALTVEAASEEPLPVALTDDLDCSHWLVADHHVNVVHEEMSAGQHLVCIRATDRDRRFADHVASCAPSAGDGGEARIRGAQIATGRQSGRLSSP
jgi:hypothetical protein